MSDPRPLGYHRPALAAAVALLTLSALTACGTSQQQAPSTTTTTTTTTTTATASPTEKNLSPTGGNLFTPQVQAPPAPTEPPGVHRNH